MTTKPTDDSFDENGICRDGKGIRVRMTAMDAENRTAQPFAKQKPNPLAARDADIERKSNAWKARG